MSTEYYVDFGLPSMIDHSITVWTNLPSICPVLTFLPSVCDYDIVYRDDDNMVLLLTVYAANDMPKVFQICKDCVTVENMLAGIEVRL